MPTKNNTITLSNDATYIHEPVVYPLQGSRTFPITRNIVSKINNNNISGFLTPARFYLSDILLKQLQNAGLSIKGETFNAQDLTDKQLKIIDDQVRYAAKKQGINRSSFINNDTIKIGINSNNIIPEMYNQKYGDANEDINNKMSNPQKQIETTLGSYNAYLTKDGYTVKDIYDYNTGQGLYPGNNSIYAKLRRFGANFGHTDKDENKYKNRFNIERTINHW